MNWYEDEVSHLEERLKTVGKNPDVIFYGSSSIRMWESLAIDFADKEVVNLGFGGSTLAACVWFFERILKDFKPKALVIYAGDNDLGDGRNPEEVLIFFQQLMSHVAKHLGSIPCYFVSLKPSPSRWNLAPQYIYANSLIKHEIEISGNNWTYIDVFSAMLDKSAKPVRDLFGEDGLHMTPKGYAIWKEIINRHLITE